MLWLPIKHNFLTHFFIFTGSKAFLSDEESDEDETSEVNFVAVKDIVC